MILKNILTLFIFLVYAAGCSRAGEAGPGTLQLAQQPASTEAAASPSAVAMPPAAVSQFTPVIEPTAAVLPATYDPIATIQTSTSTPAPAPTQTEFAFEVGRDLTIEYLRSLEISGSEITIERELDATFYYRQYIASYLSEGNKIYGLLMVPAMDLPEGGFKAIVFNHGYIPPEAYRTTERYTAYVDYLARYGFVVFKIDYRGHGESQGEASGSYFSPGYTIDAIAALKSLQTMEIIDPQGIGMWGHSMAGNLVLRSMLIEPDIQAGVIWAGAVYSYDDFVEYGIDDNTYRPPASSDDDTSSPRRRSRQIFETYGRPDTQVEYWKAVSLTENIEYLNRPIQLHHAQDDTVVNIGYSFGLADVLQESGKQYEFFTYEGGGHNLISPYFDQAMLRTVQFFQDNL